MTTIGAVINAVVSNLDEAGTLIDDLERIEVSGGSGITAIEEPPATSGWRNTYTHGSTIASDTWTEIDLSSILPANVKAVICSLGFNITGDSYYQSLDVYVRPANLTDTEDADGFYIHHSDYDIGTPTNEINMGRFVCIIPLPGSGADDGKFDIRAVYADNALISLTPTLEIVACV